MDDEQEKLAAAQSPVIYSNRIYLSSQEMGFRLALGEIAPISRSSVPSSL
jgi:hypothetical protein